MKKLFRVDVATAATSLVFGGATAQEHIALAADAVELTGTWTWRKVVQTCLTRSAKTSDVVVTRWTNSPVKRFRQTYAESGSH